MAFDGEHLDEHPPGPGVAVEGELGATPTGSGEKVSGWSTPSTSNEDTEM